jgi:hypothetical protein
MPQPAPLPPELVGRPFSIYEAELCGVSRKRIRASDLITPFRGVRDVPGRDEILQRCAAYAVRMPPDQFFSHVTAARLHGIPLPSRLSGESNLHVTSVTSRQPRALGVVGHLDRDGRTVVCDLRSLRVAAPLDAWRALSPILSVRELVVAGDALVCRKSPATTVAQLTSAVRIQSGRRGAKRLREALALVRPRTDSPMETQVRLTIVWAGLPEPEVNSTIVSAAGDFLAIGDLAYPALRVLVEYDGETHFTDHDQMFRDINRLDALMAEGWRVIRITKRHNREYIVRTVRGALRTAGWTP